MELSKCSWISFTLVVVVVILSSSVEQGSCRPSIPNPYGISDPAQRRATSKCAEESVEVRTLCQRCAKLTKSKFAYPMCCEGEQDARDWCQQLLLVG